MKLVRLLNSLQVYRSHRTGFSKYLMGSFTDHCVLKCLKKINFISGQVYEVASSFYGLESINITVLESKNYNPGSTTGPLQLEPKAVTIKFRLDFDNRAYVSANRRVFAVVGVLNIFPFRRWQGASTY